MVLESSATKTRALMGPPFEKTEPLQWAGKSRAIEIVRLCPKAAASRKVLGDKPKRKVRAKDCRNHWPSFTAIWEKLGQTERLSNDGGADVWRFEPA
ncbi:hypothetical protein JCM17478_07650 [Thermopirellula anaerolimosa]